MKNWRRKLEKTFTKENPKSTFLQVEYAISAIAFKSKVVYDPFVKRWKEVLTEQLSGDAYIEYVLNFARSVHDLGNNFNSDKIEVIALSVKFGATETNRLAN